VKDEHRLSVFEKRVLREIFVPKREYVTGNLRKLQTESFITRTAQLISRKLSNQGVRDGQGMWHVWGTGKAHTGFWWGKLKVGFALKNIGIGECIILKRRFKEYYEGYGLNSSVTRQVPVASRCEPSYPIRHGEFVDQVTNCLLASKEGLCSMEKIV